MTERALGLRGRGRFGRRRNGRKHQFARIALDFFLFLWLLLLLMSFIEKSELSSGQREQKRVREWSFQLVGVYFELAGAACRRSCLARPLGTLDWASEVAIALSCRFRPRRHVATLLMLMLLLLLLLAMLQALAYPTWSSACVRRTRGQWEVELDHAIKKWKGSFSDSFSFLLLVLVIVVFV